MVDPLMPIKVTRPDEPSFRIFHYRDPDMLLRRRTEEQAAEVAVWAADTLPVAATANSGWLNRDTSGTRY
jgi:hypothetical protein